METVCILSVLKLSVSIFIHPNNIPQDSKSVNNTINQWNFSFNQEDVTQHWVLQKQDKKELKPHGQSREHAQYWEFLGGCEMYDAVLDVSNFSRWKFWLLHFYWTDTFYNHFNIYYFSVELPVYKNAFPEHMLIGARDGKVLMALEAVYLRIVLNHRQMFSILS